MNNHNERVAFGLGMPAVIAAVFLSLYAHWETCGETWYYWFFSRLLAQTGRFCIPDRSPVYTLYLELYRWMGYPLSVTVEYFVTTLITVIALICLFRPYFRFAFLILACILWIPLMQIWEPPVQKLALACLCVAAVAREGQPRRFHLALSYAFLILAAMLRPTYMIALGVFLCWDMGKIFYSPVSLKAILPRWQDWPILLVLLLAGWFSIMQSPHPWNNCNGASSRWAAANEKSLRDAAFIQRANQAYILKTYGSFQEKDWYLTNKELFGHASTLMGAIKANPKFIAGFVFRNMKNLIAACSSDTLLGDLTYERFDAKFHSGSKWWYPYHLFITVPVVCFIFYGAFRQMSTGPMTCVVLSNILMLMTLVLAVPGGRYMFPVIPLLLLSTSFYLKKIETLRINSLGRNVLAVLVVCLFSLGTNHWATRISLLVQDISRHQLKIMETRVEEKPGDISMKASKSQLEALVRDCKGIIGDPKFLGSFMNVSFDKLYDVMEIPPFGSLDLPAYDGLRPDRVDCVLTSYAVLRPESASETNAYMRYEHYLLPYIRRLENSGARTVRVPAFGYVTVLKHK